MKIEKHSYIFHGKHLNEWLVILPDGSNKVFFSKKNAITFIKTVNERGEVTALLAKIENAT